MFKPELCDLCGECLARCQWIQADKETAGRWIEKMINKEKTPVPEQCITCYACNEYCPQGANPFDLIAELQEKYEIVPREKIREAEERYHFSGELQGLPSQEDRIMTTCVFGKTHGHLLQGELFDMPRVGGKPFFCWIIMSHMGAKSIQEKHARQFVDRLAATQAREIVCFHDDCYSMLASLAPEYGIEVPFRPVHLSEYLVECLSARKDRITPLNMNIAYQRPCASRYTPGKEHYIDRLFELCGVKRVERNYDRENALCCASVVKSLLNRSDDPNPDMEKNIADALSAGAEALVCLCPMCMHSLQETAAEHNLPLIFLGDLARMALGEKNPF